MAQVDMKSQLTALQRTAVSFVVGFLITQAARLGIKINDPSIVAALTVAVGAIWYAVFHYLEERGNAVYGWFLGKAGSPRYGANLPEEARAIVAAAKMVLGPSVTAGVARANIDLEQAVARADAAIQAKPPEVPPAA